MNIIEAVKSGMMFKRKAWSDFHNSLTDGKAILLSAGAILADDWEVDVKKIQITRVQLIEAFAKAYCSDMNRGKAVDASLGMALARELGL